MARPKFTRITCWLHAPYRKANGTLVYRFRYNLRLPGGVISRRQENVPQDIAFNARHKSAAMRYMLRRQAELNLEAEKPSGAVTLGSARDRYFEHMASRWRARTAYDTRSVLRQFVDYVGTDTLLCHIGGDRLAAYLDGRLASGDRAATHNKHLRTLRAFFGKLVGTFGFIDRNPCAGIDPLDPDEVDAEPLARPVLSDWQAAQLVREALRRSAEAGHRIDGLAIWTLAETGMRITELMTREWPDLVRMPEEDESELARTLIILPKSACKGKRPRVPPLLSAELSTELDCYRMELQVTDRLTGFVFRPWVESGPRQFKQFGLDWTRRRTVRMVRGICRDLDLPEITPHGFRRTFATTLEQLGVAAETVQRTGGWSGRKVVEEHYIDPAALNQAAVGDARKVADARQFGSLVVQ